MATILVGEDDDSIRELVQMLLQLQNYEVVCASCKTEIENQFIACHPDLLLLDINLNGDDGRQICRDLKCLQKDIKVLLMSANLSMLSVYKEYLADAAVEKPFDVALLLSEIKRLLNEQKDERVLNVV